MSPERNAEDKKLARRAFLAKCGKFAAVTPPVVTLMLSAANNSYATASSGFHHGGGRGHGRGGRHPNNGFGNGGHDGVPGRSRHQDRTR